MNCFRCGSEIPHRPPREMKSNRVFCSRSCNLKTMNEERNPTAMTQDRRKKIREAHLSEDTKGYKKLYGRHEHRVAAELILGRPLDEKEVVHHIDGDKKNNSPENLYIFKSQADHASFHARFRKSWKGVMPI